MPSSAIHDEGIIVHKQLYSESSLILTWLCRENGIVKTLAKGSLRKKSPTFGPLDLFYECHIVYASRNPSSLQTLTEVQLIHNRAPKLASYLKQLTSLYFYEVIEALTEKHTPIPEFYELYLKAISYLETFESSWKVIEHFERRAMELSGVHEKDSSIHSLRHRNYHPLPKSRKLLEQALAQKS